MTLLAEATLEDGWLLALEAQVQRHGVPRDEAGRFVPAVIVGVGRCGGRELTTGSDLYVFVVFDSTGDGEGATDGESPVGVHTFYSSAVERLAGALGDITQAGVAFAVDLRLRPGSKGSGFAASVDALERYYEEHGDLWERQTLTRARLVLGDRKLGRRVRTTLRRLVYGAPLPESALKEIAEVRTRMEVELGKETPGGGHVKLGRGGLVDVEFLTQALQLVHGAGDPDVRRPSTTAALRALGQAGALAPAVARDLIEHYGFLRRVSAALRLLGARPTDTLELAGPMPSRVAMPDDLARQLPYVRRLFEALRTPVIEVPGYEADDVLATLVEQALRETDLDVVVVSGDKDLLQLVGPRVRVLSVLGRTGEKIVYDEAKVRERWGVEPGQIADVLALMGDSIDNIKGVHGVGEKTAVKLVGQFGSVARLYEHLPLVGGKLRETLAAGRKDAFLSRELATLNRDVPLGFDLETFRRVEPDWTRLRALWMELEFTRLLKDLPAPVALVSGAPGTVLSDRAAVVAWVASVPAGEPLALDWAGEARPPDPSLAGVAIFHPAAGAARLAASDAVPLGGREVLIHDAQPVLQAWLREASPLPPIQGSAGGAD